MKITERDRLELRQQLRTSIGERSTDVLMQALPPVDYEHLATKSDLQILGSDLRGELATLRGEMHQAIGSLALENARQMRIIVTANIGSMLALSGVLLGFG